MSGQKSKVWWTSLNIFFEKEILTFDKRIVWEIYQRIKVWIEMDTMCTITCSFESCNHYWQLYVTLFHALGSILNQAKDLTLNDFLQRKNTNLSKIVMEKTNGLLKGGAWQNINNKTKCYSRYFKQFIFLMIIKKVTRNRTYKNVDRSGHYAYPFYFVTVVLCGIK